MRLVLPDRLLSPNSRVHWSARASYTADLSANLKLNLQSYRHSYSIPKAEERRQLQMTLFKKGRFFDQDNLVAALKPVVDAAVRAGFLVDDSERWLDYLMPHQRKAEGPVQLVEMRFSWQGELT